MATPQEKLAEALQALKAHQDEGRVAIKSSHLSRDARERLVRAGFLTQVIKGWYIPSRPDDVGDGETTAWYASFWDFCAAYFQARFGDEWSLSPEQSVLIHAGNRTVPKQLMIRAPRARNKTTALIHDTGIVEIRAQIAAGSARETRDGLQLFKLPNALINSTEKFFKTYPSDVRAALGRVHDSSELLAILLEGGHSTIAGRLAGALRSIGRDSIADEILKAMRAAGYTVNETDPFDDIRSVILPAREQSPYVNRMHTNWQTMREDIIAAFPKPPGIPNDINAYLKEVDELFVSDAYHSLSIEGYRVNEQLIERVRSGAWNPDQIEADEQNRDAMAARGYWLAFTEVKKSVERVLNNENAGDVADQDHRDWYRELFGPSVEAGILGAADLAGYRNDQVYIRNSKHVPLKKEAILDCMPAFFDHLRKEEHPAVRTVLGHWVFVYIHPYMDGNGRMGRFVMNVMLASGGYPWTVVPVERREDYMQALESASVKGVIAPFAKFLGSLVAKA
ncbi:MAG: Fic family protein [Pseudomonadota bacterium]